MKINILKTIDVSILDEALVNYIYETSKDPKYIIINSDTLQAIEQAVRKNIFLPQVTDTTVYRAYHGYPIAFCNKLDFGEIEIV